MIAMYINRIAEQMIKKRFDTPKVLIILGARQVGKTTLVERLLKEKGGVILNFDIEVDKARFLAISSLPPPEAIKSIGNPSLLVIDEAQRLPDVGRIIKGWYDAQVQTKIILLGSSSLNLLDQSAESLTGRNEKIYLPPLLFTELLQNQSWFSSNFTSDILKTNFLPQIQSLLLQQIVYGSYPEAVTTDDKERYLLNLTSDYLLKDVLQSGLVRSPETVRKLLMLLAFQIGSEVSVSELASNLQVTRQTVERYLELLERSFVIFRLPPFSANQRKEIVKSTKIFFWDTGVRNALLKEFQMSEYRGDIGAVWENWVIAEVAKRNLLEGQRYNVYFWRTIDGSEVDLVIKGSNLFKAYEIKWARSKTTRIPSLGFTHRYGIDVEVITKETMLNVLLEGVS